MGLSALALEGTPAFPTFPERMLPADVTAGLVLPYASIGLLGHSGAVCTLIMIFSKMPDPPSLGQRTPLTCRVSVAVTSAFSAQLIAVSSIVTYDIYQSVLSSSNALNVSRRSHSPNSHRTYINPSAPGKRLIAISHTSVCVYGVVMAGFSVGLFHAGISMGWLYVRNPRQLLGGVFWLTKSSLQLWMGVMICSAVIPATLTLFWKRQNWVAASGAPILGLICALIAWTVTCAHDFDGVLSIENLGSNNPMLVGNVVGLLSPLVFVPVLTYTFGADDYDWASMAAIKQSDDTDASPSEGALESGSDHGPSFVIVAPEQDMVKLNKASRLAKWLTVIMAVSFLVLWPMPMYGSGYIFSKPFFTGWVTVGIIWIFGSSGAVGLFPLWEGRHSIVRVTRGMLGLKKSHDMVEPIEGKVQDVPETASQTTKK